MLSDLLAVSFCLLELFLTLGQLVLTLLELRLVLAQLRLHSQRQTCQSDFPIQNKNCIVLQGGRLFWTFSRII